MFPSNSIQNEKVKTFVDALAPLVCNEYLRRLSIGHKVVHPSTCIGMACLESGYNINASTLFGIKGDDIVLDTTEFIDNEWVHIKASFEAYETPAKAVQGFYDLLQWDNYDDATNKPSYKEELDGLTNDIGYKYATAPNYKETVISIIEDFNLTLYDDYCTIKSTENHPISDDIIVLIGDKKYKLVEI